MNTLPHRRTDLVVTELDGENVVFDATANTVHALTATAVSVWELCDGTLAVDAAAARLGLTVEQVDAACLDLLDAGLVDAPGYTRRRVLQGTAVAAGAAIVSSALMPAAAAHASNPGGGNGTPTPQTYDLYSLAFAPDSPFSFYEVVNGAYVAATAPYSHPEYSPQSPSTPPLGVQGTSANPGEGAYPVFYKTPVGEYRASTIDVPKGVFALHPASDGPAIVGFTNPSAQTAKITIAATITRRDNTTSGNGVTLSAAQMGGDPAPSITGPVTLSNTGTSASFNTIFAAVPAGHFVYLLLGNNGEYSYDSTQLDLTVTVG